MKKDLVHLVIAVFTLAIGGALEDLSPKLMGVGFPVLLSATAYFAVRRSPLQGVLFAVAAGAAEDALCGLPFVLSVSFFTALAGLLRRPGLLLFPGLVVDLARRLVERQRLLAPLRVPPDGVCDTGGGLWHPPVDRWKGGGR